MDPLQLGVEMEDIKPLGVQKANLVHFGDFSTFGKARKFSSFDAQRHSLTGAVVDTIISPNIRNSVSFIIGGRLEPGRGKCWLISGVGNSLQLLVYSGRLAPGSCRTKQMHIGIRFESRDQVEIACGSSNCSSVGCSAIRGETMQGEWEVGNDVCVERSVRMGRLKFPFLAKCVAELPVQPKGPSRTAARITQ